MLLLEKIFTKSNFIFENNEIAQGIVSPQDFLNQTSKNILGDNFNIGDGGFSVTSGVKPARERTLFMCGWISFCPEIENIRRWQICSRKKTCPFGSYSCPCSFARAIPEFVESS